MWGVGLAEPMRPGCFNMSVIMSEQGFKIIEISNWSTTIKQ